MRAFLAVLVDSIRLLKARALFWISLGISVFAALIYLSIGFDETGMSVAFGIWHIDEPSLARGSKGAEVLYLGIFSNLIVGFWLSWIAVVIALISCAPIFPEFIGEGAAGVALSKPVSRPRLFLYKFTGGLLFMAVQASLFALIVFLAIRWRLGIWIPGVLWSVPVLILIFSYLFSVLVLLGIKTRSVMASVLLTLVFWLTCFLVRYGEDAAYTAAHHATNPFSGMPLSEEDQAKYKSAHPFVEVLYLVLPKPGETSALMDRWIVLPDGENLGASSFDAVRERGNVEGLDDEMKESLERHSAGWIIGTSLAFEAVVLGLACLMFSRRDF
jgi:ABC-type transport system involved in multi-copper enzyme maturation permease subunit